MQRYVFILAAICSLCHFSCLRCGADTLYVWTNSPFPAIPYDSWTNAAHAIQDAANTADPGDTVIVTNGTYDVGGATTPGHSLMCRVSIIKAFTVQSVNGPAATMIVGREATGGGLGADAIRCAYVADGGILSGFTLTNGYTQTSGDSIGDRSGGGVYSNGGKITNCVITGNSAHRYGGGVHGGTILNSTLTENNAAYRGGGTSYATVYGCIIRTNSADDGGGAYQCSVSESLLSGNSAVWWGGGARDGSVSNSIVRNNRADSGGAMHGGSMYNSSASGNSADFGGGAYNTSLNNCTVAGNAASYGGGIYNGSANNCIVYFNTAYVEENNIFSATANHTCSPDVTHGSNGNITNLPLLVSASHVAPASPCSGSGSNAYSIGTDVDGEPWFDPPTIGCDEYRGTGTVTGELTVAIDGPTNVVVGYTADFFADIAGPLHTNRWTFGDGTSVTNIVFPSHSWSSTGNYNVVLTAYSDDYTSGLSATQAVHVLSIEESTIYVSASDGNDADDGSAWTNAKETIQGGVDAQSVLGALVLVSNGTYNSGGTVTPGHLLSNRVVITRQIKVESVNGPDLSIIQGKEAGGGGNGTDAMRCAYLADGAVLAGFTLAGGYTATSGDLGRDRSGGAVYGAGGTVSNCTILGCSAAVDAGGAYGVALEACTVSSNTAGSLGGGTYGATANNTLITNNTANHGGGTAYGTANNCALAGNSAVRGGGGYYGAINTGMIVGNTASDHGGGTYYTDVNGSVVDGNSATNNAGGSWYGTIDNCRIVGNSAGSHGGGTYGSSVYNSTVSSNSAGVLGGGTYDGALNNCIVFYNTAPSGSNIVGVSVSSTCSPDVTHGSNGNITNAPLFINKTSANYRLAYGSPCIDAGTNLASAVTNDVESNPRPLDGDYNTSADYDMGAYEYNPATADSDLDFMPDYWEINHGFNPTNSGDAQFDADADFAANLAEYVADTDPTNASSFFSIVAFSNDASWTVHFYSSTSRVYSLQSSASLVTGQWSIVAGATGQVGIGGNDSFTDTNTIPATLFYRLKVHLPY